MNTLKPRYFVPRPPVSHQGRVAVVRGSRQGARQPKRSSVSNLSKSQPTLKKPSNAGPVIDTSDSSDGSSSSDEDIDANTQPTLKASIADQDLICCFATCRSFQSGENFC